MKRYLTLKTLLPLLLIFLSFTFTSSNSFASDEPYIKEYSNSGCLSNSHVDSLESSEEYPGCEDEGVSARVEGTSIYVTHFNATYNCCPDDIKVTLFGGVKRLMLNEEEILTIPCKCLCCYNVETEVARVEPGKYTVIVCWDDYETQKRFCRRIKVVVP